LCSEFDFCIADGEKERKRRADEWQIITAGYFATEDWKTGPKWEEEVRM
jgi:hypothetical protein